MQKRYEKYKDSGIEWIGEVPEHWDIIALKRMFKVINGGTPKSEEPLFWENGNVVWVTPDDLSSNENIFITNSKRQVTVDGIKNSSANIVPSKSLIISTRAPIGYIKIAGTELSTNQGCKSLVKLKNKTNEIYYYYFLLFTKEHLNAMGQGTTFTELSNYNLANCPALKLNSEEQNQTSNFLNQKTSEIDSLIADKEKLIQRLQEYKQSVITEAVTKGLNPDVKMKDSGVEWIGEVPANWITQKLKKNSYIKGRIGWQGLRADEFIDEGPYLITGMHFKNGSVDWESCYHITEERYNQAPEIQIRDNDLLITKDGTIGKVAYIENLPGKASLNSHLLVIRPLNNYFSKFLYWVFQSNCFKYYVNLSQTGTTFFGITQHKVENYEVSFPPIQEQKEIIDFLDDINYRIYNIVKSIQSQIQKLKEYRQSLIYEAVTGKIDVRDHNPEKHQPERSEKLA